MHKRTKAGVSSPALGTVFYETGISTLFKVPLITTCVYCGTVTKKGVQDHLFMEVNRWLWHKVTKTPIAWEDGLKVHAKDLSEIMKSWQATHKWVTGVQERNGTFRYEEDGK